MVRVPLDVMIKLAHLWNALRKRKTREAFGVTLTHCTRNGQRVVSGYDLTGSKLNLWHGGQRVTRLESAGQYGCIVYCGEKFVGAEWKQEVEVRE